MVEGEEMRMVIIILQKGFISMGKTFFRESIEVFKFLLLLGKFPFKDVSCDILRYSERFSRNRKKGSPFVPAPRWISEITGTRGELREHRGK